MAITRNMRACADTGQFTGALWSARPALTQRAEPPVTVGAHIEPPSLGRRTRRRPNDQIVAN